MGKGRESSVHCVLGEDSCDRHAGFSVGVMGFVKAQGPAADPANVKAAQAADSLRF